MYDYKNALRDLFSRLPQPAKYVRTTYSLSPRTRTHTSCSFIPARIKDAIKGQTKKAIIQWLARYMVAKIAIQPPRDIHLIFFHLIGILMCDYVRDTEEGFRTSSSCSCASSIK